MTKLEVSLGRKVVLALSLSQWVGRSDDSNKGGSPTSVNELEGAMVATITMNLREAKSLKKLMEMVRIDRYWIYQRALEAEVKVELFQTQESTLKIGKELRCHNEELSQYMKDVEESRVFKYKTSWRFKKGFIRMGHYSFTYSYELDIF